MTVNCPTCGRPVNAASRFCGGCGSPMAATPAPAAATPAPAYAPGFAAPAMPVAGAIEGKGLSVGQMLKFGWHTTWDNFGPVVGVFGLGILVAAVVYLAPLILTSFVADSTALLLFVIWFVLLIVAMPFIMFGLFRVALRWADGERGTVGDLFSGTSGILSFLGASILYGLIVAGGTLLFVFPGMIWAVQFGMFPFLIIEKRLGPVEALKASTRVTNGAKWDLFALETILYLVYTAGIYAFGIGVFVTAPIALIGWARAYRWLERRTPDA